MTERLLWQAEKRRTLGDGREEILEGSMGSWFECRFVPEVLGCRLTTVQQHRERCLGP